MSVQAPDKVVLMQNEKKIENKNESISKKKVKKPDTRSDAEKAHDAREEELADFEDKIFKDTVDTMAASSSQAERISRQLRQAVRSSMEERPMDGLTEVFNAEVTDFVLHGKEFARGGFLWRCFSLTWDSDISHYTIYRAGRIFDRVVQRYSREMTIEEVKVMLIASIFLSQKVEDVGEGQIPVCHISQLPCGDIEADPETIRKCEDEILRLLEYKLELSNPFAMLNQLVQRLSVTCAFAEQVAPMFHDAKLMLQLAASMPWGSAYPAHYLAAAAFITSFRSDNDLMGSIEYVERCFDSTFAVWPRWEEFLFRFMNECSNFTENAHKEGVEFCLQRGLDRLKGSRAANAMVLNEVPCNEKIPSKMEGVPRWLLLQKANEDRLNRAMAKSKDDNEIIEVQRNKDGELVEVNSAPVRNIKELKKTDVFDVMDSSA